MTPDRVTRNRDVTRNRTTCGFWCTDAPIAVSGAPTIRAEASNA
ncbi:hypothetical protein CZ674_02150 [Agrococcus casei LMG 22410]|uniref:Uncharacterized protein n=1 Tax=Agrococcus casei LMG 22410 TaxID=1255656 RepID=A0A1R4F1S3_9MICO|nr:hypothetical protein CZ674_02150 [Agrococcus casei LMG 22410]